jgi:hypothetical protein
VSGLLSVRAVGDGSKDARCGGGHPSLAVGVRVVRGDRRGGDIEPLEDLGDRGEDLLGAQPAVSAVLIRCPLGRIEGVEIDVQVEAAPTPPKLLQRDPKVVVRKCVALEPADARLLEAGALSGLEVADADENDVGFVDRG